MSFLWLLLIPALVSWLTIGFVFCRAYVKDTGEESHKSLRILIFLSGPLNLAWFVLFAIGFMSWLLITEEIIDKLRTKGKFSIRQTLKSVVGEGVIPKEEE